jgi:hypothetical protein
LLVSPETSEEVSLAGLNAWLQKVDPIKQLDRAGGLLFRGFAVKTPLDFSELLEGAGFHRTRYIAGNNPRHSVMENVYLSTTYPPEWTISLHSEMSHLESYPRYISLYCKTPAQTGTGLTPLALNAEILGGISPKLLQKLKAHGVSYVQRMKKSDKSFGFGRTWSEVFETEDPAEVEKFCTASGIKFEWNGDEIVVTHTRGPTAVHPVDGQEVWFNQGEQWHHSSLSEDVQKFLAKKVGLDKVPHHARFGNGEEFSVEELKEIRDVYARCSRRFQWEAGDVLIFDNIRLAHGRDSYLGPREVFFAMGKT